MGCLVVPPLFHAPPGNDRFDFPGKCAGNIDANTQSMSSIGMTSRVGEFEKFVSSHLNIL
jgi:hypothetical protein